MRFFPRYRLVAPLLIMLLSLFATALCLPRARAGELSPLMAEGGILQLVNRETRLSADYAPDDLVLPDVDTRKKSLDDKIYLRPAAAKALEDMFAAAMEDRAYVLYAVSGYRAYGYQQVLFNQKVAAVGRAAASRTVAAPGESEHQTGLAIDIQSNHTLTLSADFANTEEGCWVAENAHRFGFIIRYKAAWSEQTGYAFEPWHLRYIGICHATAVHMLDIPYESYYAALARLPAYAVEQGNPYLLAGLARALLDGDESVLSLLPEDAANPAKTLEKASAAYLPQEVSYQTAVWMGYPTPVPTRAPRVETDTNEVYLSDLGG